MITCSVKDKRYSDLIQSMLQGEDFLCFTTQSREDHKKLSDQFYKRMSLSVTIRTCATTLDAFRPTMSAEGLSAVGLDGFAIGFIEGPEPVLAMLCAERRLHASAVAAADSTEEQFERIIASEKISTWAAGKQSYRVTRRREYGPGAVSTATRNVPRGRYWTDQPVDAAEKTELRRKLDEATEQYNVLAQEIRGLKAKDEHLVEKETAIRDEIVSFCIPPCERHRLTSAVD